MKFASVQEMSLAMRLRLCLALCLLSIGIAIYSEWVDLNVIEDRTIELSERTVPALEKVAQMSRYKNSLEAILTRAPIESDTSALAQMANQAQQISAALKARFGSRELDGHSIQPNKLDVFFDVATHQQTVLVDRQKIFDLGMSAMAELKFIEVWLLTAQGRFELNARQQGPNVTDRQTVYEMLDQAKTLGELTSSISTLSIITRDIRDGRHGGMVNARARGGAG